MPRTFGFSLLELLIVMALLGILASIGAPGFQAALRDREGELALRMLAAQLALARTTAIERGVRVTICPSADGLGCSDDWRSGSMVFTDLNGDRLVNPGDLLVRVNLTAISGSIQWRAFQSRQYLQIDPMGFMRNQSGNFTYCPVDGDARLARQLVVNATGRTRLAIDTDGDGLREDSSGQPLRCN